MPRPRPDPENEPDRTTISLPLKLTIAGEMYRVQNPAADIRDFSALMSKALTEYLEKHHPGLIAQVTEELREQKQKLAAEEHPPGERPPRGVGGQSGGTQAKGPTPPKNPTRGKTK